MSNDHHPDETNTSATTPAGWFDDPHGKHDLRYWDGSAWTEHVHDRDPVASPAQPPASVVAVPADQNGQNGRKWGVLIAVILLIGAVILAVTSLSGSDSTSAIDSGSTSSVSGASDGAGNGSDLQDGDTDDNDSDGQPGDDQSQSTAGILAPNVVYTAPVEAANTDYGSISDQIAVAGGLVWVVSPESVIILDESTGESVGSIPADSTDAAGLFVDGSRVWLLSPFTKTLSIINTDSRTVEGEVVLTTSGHRPTSGLLLTDGYAWVPNGNVAVSDGPVSDIIEVIDTTTLSVVGQLEVTEGANHLLLADGKIWMVNSLSNYVTAIDIDTLTVVATIPSGDFPSDIAYADGLIWVANSRGATVSVIDPASFEVINEIRVGLPWTQDDQQLPGPRRIFAAGGSVWITMSQDNSVKAIDTTTQEVADSLPFTGTLGFTDSTLWVAAGTEVEAIDLTTRQSVGTVSGGTEFVYDMTSTTDGVWVISEDNTVSKLALTAG